MIKQKIACSLGLLLGLLLFLSATKACGQGLAAYVDFREHFYVFDKGNMRQLEHLPVLTFKVGKWGLAYQRNDGALMIYHNGVSRKLSEVVENYEITDGLLVYTYNNNLFVYEGRDKTLLSMNAPYYKADEHLVAYYDDIDKMFKVYYKGEIFDVESALSSPPVDNFEVGDNIIAYMDPNNYLQAFFEGATRELMLAQGKTSYRVDRNLVTFYDETSSALKLFHVFGQRDLAAFRPLSFKVADERVAFVDNTGNFKLYENDQVRTLSNITPDFYVLRDSLLIYGLQNELMAYYDGQIQRLENFIPSTIRYVFNLVAYLTERNHLRVFDKGRLKTLTYEPANRFEVFWDVVWYNIGVNSNKVYYDGVVY